jgi:hypothetical protein
VKPPTAARAPEGAANYTGEHEKIVEEKFIPEISSHCKWRVFLTSSSASKTVTVLIEPGQTVIFACTVSAPC